MFVAVVALLVVPLQMALIPILRLYNNGAIDRRAVLVFPDLDLVGTFLGVWLAHTALRAAARDLPAPELHRLAAVVDHRVGEDRRRRPLHDLLAARSSRCRCPPLAAFAIFQFLWVWNDLLVAYVFLGGTQENRVLTIALWRTWWARRVRTGTC